MDDRLRIINLGLPKSGTTTLGVALDKAGLKVADWRIRKGQSDDRRILFGFVGDHLYRGYYETGDPLALLPDFDAVTEMSVASHGLSLWPQMDWGLLEAIRKHHPNTKFVLSHRDPAALVKSMLGWSNLGKSRLPQQAIPGLPAGYGGAPDQLLRWVEGHYSFCRRVFRDDPDFLEYDLADPDAAQKISAFLGIDLPWWGRANAKDRGEDSEAQAAPALHQGVRPPRQVFLHAGAEGCGTGALQARLLANRDSLAARGFALALPEATGEGLRLKLPELRHDAAEAARLAARAGREIDRLAGQADRLILSEETIPGRSVHLYSGRFYPAAESRAAALATALGGGVAHLLFVIRPYDAFFSAVHRARAARRAVPDLADVAAALDGLDRGWPELIATLQQALRPDRFTVIEADDGQGAALAARLLPDLDPADLAAEDAAPAMPPVTDRALVAIQQALAANPKLPQDEIERLIALHAGDAADLGFARWPESVTAQWRHRYAADLDRIAAMPDIALMRGPSVAT